MSYLTGKPDLKFIIYPSVHINFRTSTSIKPSLIATLAGDRIEFLDIMNAVFVTTDGNGGSNPGKEHDGSEQDPNG